MLKFQPVLELLRKRSTIHKDIHDAFGEAYVSKEKISHDNFNTLIKYKLGLPVKDSDVCHLFCQIDRYSKGSITSDELHSYICEYEDKRFINPERPFETAPMMYPGVRSRDNIVEWILFQKVPEITSETADHYFFISRCGVLCVLNKDIEKRLETTIETIDDGESGKGTVWATTIASLPREKLIAVATSSGDIRFFKSSICRFVHRFSIAYLPFIVLRLDCYASEKLICGTSSGSVFTIQMDKDFFNRIKNRASHLGPEKIRFDRLKRGKVPGLLYKEAKKLHFGSVQKVEYIPSLKAVISCSLNTKRAMMIHDLKDNHSRVSTCQGGITCFAFFEKFSCIITGGVDQTIKRWNPAFISTYSESLTGHTSPITHVQVYENQLLIVSVDCENTVRVWDYLKPECIQIIEFKESDFPGKQGFSTVFLDPNNGNLILTTNKIGKLNFYQEAIREKTHPCSEYIILAAYSKVYNCLVTVGNSSVISTWDAETGSLIYEFGNSHAVLDYFGNPHNTDILTAGLDPSERRLVTADRIGKIKVWNFHLGVCLNSFETNCIILSLAFTGFHIYAAGTSKVVIDLFDNGDESVDAVIWDKRHSKTIVSLDCYGKDFLASASPDGEILVWFSITADSKVQMKDLKEDEQNVEVSENYRAKAEIERRRKCSISQILFLQKRQMDPFVGNLVSCGPDGRIRFWNIVSERKVNEGKLLSKFKAVFGESHYVLCLATDADNHYLISGDTMGYIRIYDIDGYYDEYGADTTSKHDSYPQQLVKFPFLKIFEYVVKKNSKFYNEPEVGTVPILLNCFRAHLEAVLRVSYVSERDTLITAGREGSVRLWTISGIYIGRLGPTNELWRFPVTRTVQSHMPPDIKRVASTSTLFVLNNGTTPLWSRALKTVKKHPLSKLPTEDQPEDFSEKPFQWTLTKADSTEESLSQGNTIEEELAKRLPYFRGKREKRVKRGTFIRWK